MTIGTPNSSSPILRVRGLRKYYGRRSAPWRRSVPVVAIDGVDFEIGAGKTLALVGSSGSGKSTIARCVTRLEKPDSGEIWLGEAEISQLSSRGLRQFRSDIQMIFQDPSTAMNPAFSAAEAIEEPLLIQQRGNTEQRRQRVMELMDEVGLSSTWADRNVMAFSGGQRQRIAITRALAIEPKVLVLDEAFTGLDLSTQAQIANLLLDLQATHSLGYLLISHDLGLVAKLADEIAVISKGKIVEHGPMQAIVDNAQHVETQKLLTSRGTLRRAAGAGI